MLLVPRDPVAFTAASMLLPDRQDARLYDWTSGAFAEAEAGNAGQQVFGEQIAKWKRPSGIPRPSSASASAISAALACQRLIGLRKWTTDRLGILAAVTTAAAAISVQFDKRGLDESWQAVDPLAFPSTLPSAPATQVATAIGAKAGAWSCVLHSLGIFNAAEAAVLMLQAGDADTLLLVVAEEQNTAQTLASAALGTDLRTKEIAAAVSIEKSTGSGVEIAFIGYAAPGELPIPSEWRDVHRIELNRGQRYNGMSNVETIERLIESVAGLDGRAVLVADVPELGSAAMGIVRR